LSSSRQRLAAVLLALAVNVVALQPQSSDPIPGYLQQIDIGNLTTVATDLVTLYGPRREDQFSPYLDDACTLSGIVYPQTTLDMAADYIRDRFLAMGYPPSAITYEVLPGTAGKNVYATKVGTTYPNVFIEFSGHYDSVAGSPGGADNASGSTGVIELARVLKDYPSQYSMRFILWAAEEFSPQRGVAFYGSNFHVQQALARGEQIKAGLVMDHIGWANPADPTGYFNEVSAWGTESNRIADLFGTVTSQYGLVLGVGKDQAIQNSDEHSYWDYGQVAVSSGGGWLFHRPNYHVCGDTVANIDFINVQRVTQQNLAVGLRLDAEPYGVTGTTTALSSSPNPSLIGQMVTLTATVTANTGTPTGTVTFRDGSMTLGSATLSASGIATFSTSLLAVGPHGLSASYGGDASHAGSSSVPLVHTVNQTGGTAPTITALSPGSAFAGDPAFTLTVTGTNFIAGATVRWNGADRPTTLVSGTQVTAAIGAADVAAPGTASVTVFTPGSSGGVSSAWAFTIAARPAGRIRAAWALDEGNGSIVQDATGNGNTGTTQNGAAWAPGRYGTALAFDGIDDYVSIPNSPGIDLAGADLTIEAWVNVAPGAPNGLLLSKPWVAGQSVYPYHQYALEYSATGNQFVFQYGTTIFGPRSFAVAAPGSGWHHIAFTYDGASAFVRGYVDGIQQLALQVPFPLEARGTPLLLGVDGALGYPFHGSLDDVRIYAAALTETEIQADMNTPVTGPPSQPAVTGLTPDAGPIGTAVTLTGRGFTGATLVRFATTDQTAFSIVDDGTIATTVPAGAVTGVVQVVTPAGTATSTAPFTVTALPALSVSGVSAIEGTTATFQVTLSAASSQTVTVGYATSDGTAAAGSDYQAGNGTLTLSPGVTAGTIEVALTADSLDELDETFVLTLSTPSNATLGTSSATGTILDDDAPPALSVGDVAVTESDSGSVNASFTVSLSAASGREVSVSYATADGTALAGSDYTAVSGTLVFPAGTSALTVDVPVVGDGFAEATESFTLRVVGPVGATIADDTGLGTVLDNDPSAVLSIGGATVTEGNSGAQNAVFTVTLSPAAAQTVTVTFATADGSALAGSDYSATSGTLTFDPGVTSRTVSVPVLGDTRDELAETFAVILGTASGASIGTGSGTGTIIDNDAAPSVVIGNVTVTEGHTGTATASFIVTLSAASGQSVSVDFATADGTAAAGADYTASSGTLSFEPGTTSRTIAVPVLGDVLDEANETFTVLLSNPINVTVADASGLGTISDDDARPALRVNDVTVTEGHSGIVEATFTVTLSAPSGLTVTVTAATADGTAIAGADYTATSGTLTFAPGDTSRTVTVSILGDVLDEANETFTLRLSSAINASVADSSGRGTVTDDDPLPTLAINDLTVSEDALTATFTVSLSTVSGRTVTVRYATLNGTAVSGSDYTSVSGTISFAAGSTTATVTVPILNDVVTEATEAFSVRLSSASNASIADNTGVCTIAANDSP
jgi:hypothetical protein